MNRNLHSLPDHAAPDQVRHPGSRGKRPQASDLTDLDSYVDAFETAILQSGLESKSIDYRQYLPDVTSPIYLDVAGEVVRIDLETRWSRGEHVTVESYRPHVTELFADTDSLSELLFEEYRQRYLAGTPVPRHQYAERYGISTSSWPDYDTVARSADKTKHGPVTRPDGSERNERSTNSLRFAAATIEQLGRMPEIGESLNGFQLVDVLGEGAFARVYLARQSQLGNRRVALKVSTSPSVEADRLAILQHTNIVPIYSSGRSAGWDLVCMPYLGSVTLRDLLHDLQAAASRGESLSGQSVRECIDAREHPSQREIYADSYRHLDRRTYTDAILWIIAKISDGLTRAHELGIVHGDLKPANILLASDGEPRILDFNLSQFNATEVPTRALVGGTLPYMSPQQLQATLVGGDLTPQDDVYSLGVIAYELLTLKPPFPRHEGEFEVVAHQMMDDRRQVPPMVYRVPQGTLGSVRTIVSKCLTPPPAGRYATALPLAEDLHRQLRNERLRHTPGETLRDRANKWVRRHPRVTSAGTVTLAAALVVGLLVAGMVRQARVVAQQSATESFHVFQDEQKTARAMLAISGLDPGTIQNAIATAENALLRIHVS
ncbi:MAG: serine/threonine protein kinase, partial [Planctomycetales bacterium]|nr:serine/threonine protein kinase [Planctomycetales bacterium]